MKKFFALVFCLFFAVFFNEIYAQCAMCTVVAEEAMKNGSSQGAGINKGVLFLFSMPYLIVGTLGFVWWRKRAQARKEKV